MPLEYHEPREQLPPMVVEQHRAIASVIEELEAVAWYHQRAALCQDAELKAVMEHNRDEEIEHAVMGLEWIRRNFAGFDDQMRTYLFQSGSITSLESGEGGEEGPDADPSDASAGSLNIGPMK